MDTTRGRHGLWWLVYAQTLTIALLCLLMGGTLRGRARPEASSTAEPELPARGAGVRFERTLDPTVSDLQSVLGIWMQCRSVALPKGTTEVHVTIRLDRVDMNHQVVASRTLESYGVGHGPNTDEHGRRSTDDRTLARVAMVPIGGEGLTSANQLRLHFSLGETTVSTTHANPFRGCSSYGTPQNDWSSPPLGEWTLLEGTRWLGDPQAPGTQVYQERLTLVLKDTMWLDQPQQASEER